MSQHDTRSRGAPSSSIIKEVSQTVAPKYNFCEVAEVYELLRIAGQCYVKEHLLMQLNGDKSGFIREWHQKVTIKSLDHLTPVAKEMGLTLPFPKSPEAREAEIKNGLKGLKEQIVTDGEALLELKFAGRMLGMFLAQALLTSTNKELRGLFCDMQKCVCEEYTKTMEHLKNTDSFFPTPVVEKFSFMSSGITERK